jgi:hypothetical protein
MILLDPGRFLNRLAADLILNGFADRLPVSTIAARAQRRWK